jgi:hypothetical protein
VFLANIELYDGNVTGASNGEWRPRAQPAAMARLETRQSLGFPDASYTEI